MASQPTQRSKSRFRVLRPSAALLSAAAGSSALVAFITLQHPVPPKAVSTPEAARAIDPPPPESAPKMPPKGPQREGDRPPQEASQERIPPLEHVLAKKLGPVAVRLDVALQGIDAFLHDFHCPPPYTMVETGRMRAGDVGCGVTKGDGYLVRLGRWVHRAANGNLEVGSYQDGLKTGVWETYAASGMLLETGEYQQGNREGSWNTFSEDGSHLANRSYRGGYFDGVALLFHRHKPIVEIWKRGQLVDEERDFSASHMVFQEDGTVRKDLRARLPANQPHVPALLAPSPEETP